MDKNRLELNENKTELLAIGNRNCLAAIKRDPLTLSDDSVAFQRSARYLGVCLDETLSFDQHISSVCRTTFYHLKRLRSIRSYLSVKALTQLVISFILSRLDYCNAVLAGLPLCSIKRLQRVQNSAARVVLRKSKRDSVTPLLKQLHWLPVDARVEYKVATLAYRYFEGTLPDYLSSLPTPQNATSDQAI